MKVCNQCNQEKPIDSFYLHKGARTSEGYRNPKCKECANKQSILWAKSNPEKVKAHRRKVKLKKKYGITLTEYESLLKSQNGKCAICNKTQERDRPMNVDHCHKTGKVRGILCDKCNMAIGLFNENLASITKAYKYLESHENIIT